MKKFSSVHGRLARPAGFRRNMGKTLVQIVAMWSIFLILAPAGVYYLEGRLGFARFRFSSRFWRAVGIALFVLGGALGLISGVVMVANGEGTPLPADATRRLVVAGPYRYVRNPMAMGSLAQGVAVGLYLGSPLVTLYGLAGTVGWHHLVRPWEEADLEWRFGEPYARYRDSVPLWFPRLRPYNPAP